MDTFQQAEDNDVIDDRFLRKEEEDDNTTNTEDKSNLDALQERIWTEREVEARKDDECKWKASYRYFRPERFLEGLNISDKTIAKARTLILTEDMKPVRVNIGYSKELGTENIVGVAYSGRGGWYSFLGTRLVFGKNRILESHCEDRRCHNVADADSYLHHKLCEHQVATILMTQEWLDNNNTGDSSSYAGIRFINEMQELLHDERNGGFYKSQNPLYLEPVVEVVNEEQLSVSFRVGIKRLYKIKNLATFVEGVRKNESMIFGKETELQLGRTYFDDKSLQWLDFIEKTLFEQNMREKEVASRTRGRYYVEEYHIGKSILLYGEALDRFFDSMRNTERSVEFILKDYQEHQKYFLTANDGRFPVPLSVKPEYDLENDFLSIRLK